eukprot:gene4139-4388_t
MTLKSGKVVDLDKLAADAKGQCCLPRSVVGDDSPIARMDGSNGRYFVTNDPKCGNILYASSYAVTYSYIYVCGQCKGGPPCTQYPVDGGKTVVMPGGSCVKADGSYDISKTCSTAAPVCQSPGSGTCVAVGTPLPCLNYANLGGYCDDKQGKCCGGAPKNAKCENNKCVSTYPSPVPPPTPAPVGCKSYANLGGYCDEKQGKCCNGAPKNAKCQSFTCVTTYPTPAPAPAPAGCKSYANLGGYCDDKQGKCCNGAPKNAKCQSFTCVTTYPSPASAAAPAPATVTEK